MSGLVQAARAAKELLDRAPLQYGIDSYRDSCRCAVCEFRRAATPDAVLALVTVGQREQDAPSSTSQQGE